MTEGTSAQTFSAEEERALAAVLDEIVPPSADRRLPGAGEIGLARHIERSLQAMQGLGPVVAQGLAALENLARGRGVSSFAALSRDERLAVLDEIPAQEPAFLPTVTFLAYAGYYQHERVAEALGLEARPPHPKGYEVEANDLSLLDRVRRRPRLYREC
jgi:hypothetical protein